MSRITRKPAGGTGTGTGVTFTDGTTIDFTPSLVASTTVTAEVTAVVARRDAANAFTGGVQSIIPAAADTQALLLSGTNTSSVPALNSVITGGIQNLDATTWRGAGAVFYSGRSNTDQAGRLVVINQAGALNPQSALRVQNAGTGISVSLLGSNTGGNEVLDVVSNSLTTTPFGVTGDNNTQGVVKLTHNKPLGGADNSDNAGAVLRLNWQVTAETATTAITGRSGNNLLAAGHTFAVGNAVAFVGAAFSGTGIAAGALVATSSTTYYVISVSAGVSFQVSTAPGGTALTLSGSPSGTAQLRARTAEQGIYVYSENNDVTTGDLITIYNGDSSVSGTERLRLTAAGQLSLSIPTGTAPLAVTSTTVNTNLNADLVDGQHGAFYLDRANHTGTQLAATVSDFTGAVTALLTDANIPNTITLDNITQVTTRVHASLQTLGADDHTQYALLAGRSLGQTLIGGTGSGESLTLTSTSNVTKGSITSADQLTLTTQGTTGGIVIGGDAAIFRAAADVVAVGSGDSFIGRTVAGSGASSGTLTLQSTTNATKAKIVLEDRAQIHSNSATTTAAYNAMDMLSGATLTLNGASASFRGFFIPSNATISITADPAAASIQMFGLSPTITSTGNRTVGTTLGANVVPTITPASGSTTTWGAMTGFAFGGTLTAPGGGGTAAIASVIGLSTSAVMSIGAGWTVTTYTGFQQNPPLNSGTVSSYYGIDLGSPAFTATTDNVSLRSVSTTLQMRHGGPAVVGTTGAPNTSSGLDVAGDFSVRLSGLTLATGGGAKDDIAIGNASFVRIAGPTADFNITSIGTPYSGKIVTLVNTTAFKMTITNAAGTGTLTNRILTSTGADLAGGAAGTSTTTITLIYDGTGGRWRDLAFRP